MVNKERRLYSPRIKNERVRQLYALKLETKKPMTVIVEEALELYFAQLPTIRVQESQSQCLETPCVEDSDKSSRYSH